MFASGVPERPVPVANSESALYCNVHILCNDAMYIVKMRNLLVRLMTNMLMNIFIILDCDVSSVCLNDAVASFLPL